MLMLRRNGTDPVSGDGGVDAQDMQYLVRRLQQHSSIPIESSRDLQYLTKRFNREIPVLNADRFTLATDHIPIVVYVYRRKQYLREVLRHLRNATGIKETLLIVSVDGTVPDMVDLVEREADFCQVKLLLHPVSSHRACDYDGCPIFRLKEHWWWLQNVVWDGPAVAAVTNSRWRLFLEEDHCVTRDAYRFLQQMVRLDEAAVGIPRSKSSSFGVGLTPMMDRTPKVKREPWHVLDYHWGIQNAGYAFSRSIWEAIKANTVEFHSFHDGWDVTLLHLMQINLLPSLVLLPRLSHLRNIGVSGVSQQENWYEEIGFGNVAVSSHDGFGVDMKEWSIGSRILGKDPSELPYMGAFGSKYDFDALRPGELNNNWDGNYGPDVSTHWGVRGDWAPGKPYEDGWDTPAVIFLCLFVGFNAMASMALCSRPKTSDGRVD